MTAKRLKEKYQRDLKELQDNCTHEETKWLDYQWAPGHYTGKVNICERCEKIISKGIEEKFIT